MFCVHSTQSPKTGIAFIRLRVVFVPLSSNVPAVALMPYVAAMVASGVMVAVVRAEPKTQAERATVTPWPITVISVSGMICAVIRAIATIRNRDDATGSRDATRFSYGRLIFSCGR